MQLGYFQVIAEPVSTWVQVIFAFAIALLLAVDASLRLMSPPRSYLASGSSDGRGKLIQDAAVELRPVP
jgi:hypothetical protein